MGIWNGLLISGVHYLMETAGIVDVIVNAMALTFVLEIDEMVYKGFTTAAAQYIVERVEDIQMFETEDLESETDEDVLKRFQAEEMDQKWRLFRLLLPKRLLQVMAVQMIFTL